MCGGVVSGLCLFGREGKMVTSDEGGIICYVRIGFYVWYHYQCALSWEEKQGSILKNMFRTLQSFSLKCST